MERRTLNLRHTVLRHTTLPVQPDTNTAEAAFDGGLEVGIEADTSKVCATDSDALKVSELGRWLCPGSGSLCLIVWFTFGVGISLGVSLKT